MASWSRFMPPMIMEGLGPQAGDAAAAATQRAALTASDRLQFLPHTGPADACGPLSALSTCVHRQYPHLGDITRAVLTSPIADGGSSDHARRSASCVPQPVRCCGSPARVAPPGVQSSEFPRGADRGFTSAGTLPRRDSSP